MKVKRIITGSYGENCYVVTIHGCRYVIDPGANPDKIVEAALDEESARTEILLTHAHFDHIGAVAEIARRLNAAAVRLGEEDVPIYSSPLNACNPDYMFDPGKPKTTAFEPDDNYRLLVLPGHSPGGRGFYFEDDGKRMVFSGDSLFKGSIGRTDLWGGDFDALVASVKAEILGLPDDTIVFPGHGEASTVTGEKRENPYL